MKVGVKLKKEHAPILRRYGKNAGRQNDEADIQSGSGKVEKDHNTHFIARSVVCVCLKRGPWNRRTCIKIVMNIEEAKSARVVMVGAQFSRPTPTKVQREERFCKYLINKINERNFPPTKWHLSHFWLHFRSTHVVHTWKYSYKPWINEWNRKQADSPTSFWTVALSPVDWRTQSRWNRSEITITENGNLRYEN